MTFLAVSLVCFGCDASSNGFASSGPPAPWPVQLATAERAAYSLDPNAALYSVIAFPPDDKGKPWDPSQGPLEVQFDFVRPTGDKTTVTVADTSPTSTLQINQNTDPRYRAFLTPALKNGRQIEAALASVVLDPRAAGEVTWTDAKSHASQMNLTVSPVIGLLTDGTPARWRVLYRDVNRSDANFGYDFAYTVDARTGAILEKQYQK